MVQCFPQNQNLILAVGWVVVGIHDEKIGFQFTLYTHFIGLKSHCLYFNKMLVASMDGYNFF